MAKENKKDPVSELTEHVTGKKNTKATKKVAKSQAEVIDKDSISLDVDEEITLTNDDASTVKEEAVKVDTPKEEEKVVEEPPKNFVLDKEIFVEKYGHRDPGSIKGIERLNQNVQLSAAEIENYMTPNFPSKVGLTYDDIDIGEDEELSEKDQEWTYRIGASSDFCEARRADLGMQELYNDDTLKRGNWGQFVTTANNEKIGLTTAGINLATNGPLRGDKAVAQVRAMLGLGNMARVPLWHTGIWVTLNTPSESEVIDLYRIINNNKVTIGRMTHGLAFSNLSGITCSDIVNFVLNHVENTSLKIPEGKVLKDVLMDTIVVQDIPVLIWGIVCTMFPRGFEYTRQCIAKPSCRTVVKELLDVKRLLFVDRSSLPEKVVAHMSLARNPGTISLDDVAKYKKELERIQPTEVKIMEKITNRKGYCDMLVTLRSPSIQQYIESTNSWISHVENLALNAPKFNKETGESFNDEQQRREYILEQAQATKARQHIHWVSSIKYVTHIEGEDETFTNFIDDPEDIINVATQVFSLNDKIISKLTDEVINYVNKSTISLVGIPSYDCPKCNKEQKPDNVLPRFVNFIPLDVIMLFFLLVARRSALLSLR